MIPVPSENQAESDRESVSLFLRLLDESAQEVKKLDRYTAQLEKQVRLKGVLQDRESMEVKIRQKPFAVYLRWAEDGKEALYVEGEHDNQVLARAQSGLAALKGVWELDPESEKAMEGNRYPITEIGLAQLAKRVCDYYDEAMCEQIAVCEHRSRTVEGKPVIEVNVAFSSPENSRYSRGTYSFNGETKLLFGVELCEWDYKGDPAGLAEKFVYHDIDTKNCPEDPEFEPNYPGYSLASEK